MSQEGELSVADVILCLDNIGADSVSYHKMMHRKMGHEADGEFKPWGRPLYKTGNLYNSYLHNLYQLSDNGGSVIIRNKAPYSPFLGQKGYPHIYKSEFIDELVDYNTHNMMTELIMG